MPNPYGITEVNVPQLYGMAMQAQESRIRNLLLQRQVQAAEREEQTRGNIRQIIARAFAPSGAQGGGQTTTSPQPASRSMADVAQMFGQPETAWTPQTGPRVPGNIDMATRRRVPNADGSFSTVRSMSFGTPDGEVLIPTIADDGRQLSESEAIEQYRRTGRHLGIFRSPADATAFAQSLSEQQGAAQPAQPAAPRLNMRELFGQLVGAGMDVGEARQTAQALSGADPQQLQMLQQRSQALASVLLSARRMPLEQRRAFIMQAAPQLQEFGIDANSIDPSDQYLDAQIALGTPIAQALEQAQPQLRNVGPGDVVIDVRNPQGGPVYESPYVEQQGMVFRRPQSMRELPRVNTPEEAQRLPPGTEFIDPQGNVRTVPGGPPASPAGSFPPRTR